MDTSSWNNNYDTGKREKKERKTGWSVCRGFYEREILIELVETEGVGEFIQTNDKWGDNSLTET